MFYFQRLLIGLILLLASVFVLWWGSPMRTGMGEPLTAAAIGFVMLFALGFIFAAMGVLGFKDYPGFLSGLVLYLIVGALIAVVFYTTGTEVGRISLEDAAHSEFWVSWIRVAATWPLELVRRAEFMDYHLLRLGTG